MKRYQPQEFIDEKTILKASHFKNIEAGITNLEEELLLNMGSFKSPNLFDIEDVDALFANGEYLNTSGVSANASQYNDAYPCSDKIYINGNEGTFKLDLKSGKTYRWQFIPYAEYGFLKMNSPWGPQSSMVGKQFWFYDADDKMIANDATCSPDGKYLMTIPEGAVYMRFQGWGYKSNKSFIKPLYSTLMVTEGEEEYTEYQKPGIIEVDKNEESHHGCYCDFTNEVLSIVYHYNATNDMRVQLKRKGPNSIVDILGWALLPKKTNGNVQNDLTSGVSEVAGWGSDFHGPFASLKAKHNPLNNGGPDVNGVRPPGFTGGNHGYKNTGASITSDPQNTPTGRSGIFKVFADGVEITTEDEGRYCDRVNIYWENFVQAQNTVLPDGSGREVLKEIHEVLFHNGEFTEEVKLVPLEAINITFYYGIQGMTIAQVFGDSIYYGGSKTQGATRKIHASSVTANSESTDAYQAICTGPNHTLFMEIDPTYDMGTRWGYTVTTGDTSSICCNANAKLYFQLIRAISGINMYQGSCYSFRCRYGVRPTVNSLAVRAITNSLTNVTLQSNMPDVAVIGNDTYLYYTANEGFTLPTEIAVENASYTWEPSIGELKLYDITATRSQKVKITITA